MPAWLAAAVPLVVEPVGQLVHKLLPALLYAPRAHTAQVAAPEAAYVPAAHVVAPPAVPSAPLPAHDEPAGQVAGVLSAPPAR